MSEIKISMNIFVLKIYFQVYKTNCQLISFELSFNPAVFKVNPAGFRVNPAGFKGYTAGFKG